MIQIVLPAILLCQTSLPSTDARIPGYEGQTKQIVERALQQYTSARTYQDTLDVRLDVETKDGNLDAPIFPGYRIELAWERPNRIALRTEAYSVFSDGKTLWECTLWEQYRKQAAPSRLDLAGLELARLPFYRSLQHPLAWVLTGADAFKDGPFENLAEFKTVNSEPLDGKPGKRLQATAKIEAGPTDTILLPVDLWFDDVTGLLEEMRYDHTEAVQQHGVFPPGTPKITKAVQVMRFRDVRRDGPIPPEQFVFKPGKYDREASVFSMPRPDQWVLALKDRPAPDFAGEDMNGKPVKLADFKGQVLVLDFWSIGCGPCLMAMPGLQKLADLYAGKPVSVVGVNTDPASSHEQVIEQLKKRNIKYRHLKDPTSKVSEAYRVSPIPCLFVVDQEGIVQDVHLGYAPGYTETELAKQIDTLLKHTAASKPAEATGG